MLTLSLIFVLVRTRSNLFWHFWIASLSIFDGSESFHLTLPRSWRPYQIFDMYRLSLIFSKDFVPMWFLIQRIKNSLCLRFNRSHPVPTLVALKGRAEHLSWFVLLNDFFSYLQTGDSILLISPWRKNVRANSNLNWAHIDKILILL